MSKAQKLQDTGDKMTEIGKMINGIVWGSVFLAIIVFLIWHVSTS